VAGGGDAGGPVDVDPQVVVAPEPPFAGVHPHPHPQGAAVRPRVRGERPLGGDRGPDRPRGRGEHREEGVPLGTELPASSGGDGLPHEPHVVVLNGAVAVAQLLEELGGPLDVGEQGDRPGGELGHPSSRA